MTTELWKNAVAQAFDAAVESYDGQAAVQRWVAGELSGDIQLLQEGVKTRSVLEIGCGTGALASALLPVFDRAHWLITDVAPAMVAACEEKQKETAGKIRGSVTYHVMDGEDPVAARDYCEQRGWNGFDLICSSLAFQWFADLPGTVARLRQLLAPKGHLVFTTLGSKSFGQWKAALEQAGLDVQGLNYPDFRQLLEQAGRSGAVSIREEEIREPYSSARDFLNMLSGLGADRQKADVAPVSTAKLRRALRSLEEDPSGIAVDYEIFFVVCSAR